MLDLLSGGVAGGIFGALTAIVPKALNYLDAKNRRSHQLKLIESGHAHEIDIKRLDRDIELGREELKALREGIKQQGKLTGIWWVDAACKLVRPAISVYMVAVYSIVKLSLVFSILKDPLLDWTEIAPKVWTVADMTILMYIVSFWFVGRQISKGTQ